MLQHAPWLGRLLAASILLQAGVTTAAHLAGFNIGLKSIPVDRGRHRDRETRLLAIAQGVIAAAGARPAGAGQADDGAQTDRPAGVIKTA